MYTQKLSHVFFFVFLKCDNKTFWISLGSDLCVRPSSVPEQQRYERLLSMKTSSNNEWPLDKPIATMNDPQDSRVSVFNIDDTTKRNISVWLKYSQKQLPLSAPGREWTTQTWLWLVSLSTLLRSKPNALLLCGFKPVILPVWTRQIWFHVKFTDSRCKKFFFLKLAFSPSFFLSLSSFSREWEEDTHTWCNTGATDKSELMNRKLLLMIVKMLLSPHVALGHISATEMDLQAQTHTSHTLISSFPVAVATDCRI